jgi:hypothetical protein
MKNLKTILKEVAKFADEYEALCDAERTGEISLRTYLRACAVMDADYANAMEWLRENYQRAGVGHLAPGL